MRRFEDFLKPKRTSTPIEIAVSTEVNKDVYSIECYWPESNPEPMFRVLKNRRCGEWIPVNMLSWFERELGKLSEEYKGEI